MKKTFIYGVAVEGDNFTDRTKETERLKRSFEHGQNVILISPRRMGKTSLVRRVQSLVDTQTIAVVYINAYDCRSESQFYNKFAAELMIQTSEDAEAVKANIKEVLEYLKSKLEFELESDTEKSISSGRTANNYMHDGFLYLPEVLAQKIGKHIVVCIDEFQQICELHDSISILKKMRSMWQLHSNASYCLLGSKKHLMTNIFKSRRSPFFAFGETIFLQPIATKDWKPFIRGKFEEKGICISDTLIERLCATVQNQSSYVQQLAANVMLNATDTVTEQTLEAAIDDMLNQNTLLFVQQMEGLSAYQINFMKAIAHGINSNFTSKETLSQYDLGSKSNVSKIKEVLKQKELIDITPDGIVFSDPVFQLWFTREWC